MFYRAALTQRETDKSPLCYPITFRGSVPLSEEKTKVLQYSTAIAQFTRKAFLLVSRTVISHIFPRAS